MQTIGVLSKTTGCPIETIRYYEKIGVLPLPPRSASGHRLYNSSHTQQIFFILNARRLGFSLDEIRELLSLASDQSQPCQQVLTIAERQLLAVEQRISLLAQLQSELKALSVSCRSSCADAVAPNCAIIDALNER